MILSWKPTKFYGDNSAHLLDEESTQTLIKTLESKYNININIGFKTPSYKYFKMLKEPDFDMLRQYHHMVTVSYGIYPLWLLWLTTINGIQYNLYVNLVTKQIIWSRHRFSPKLYNETIFEGEMIDSNFLIWDLLVHKGTGLGTYNHFRRQDTIRSILDHQYVPDPVIENIKLINREYVTYQHIKSFLEKMTENPQVPNQKPKALSFIPVGKSVKIYNLILSNRTHIEQLNSLENKLEYPIDYHPTIVKTGKMVHPPLPVQSTDDKSSKNKTSILNNKSKSSNNKVSHSEKDQEDQSQFCQNFWLSPVEGYVDNYWQYVEDDTDPNSLVKVGLIITQTKENSLKVRDTFDQVPVTYIKSGIRGLLKWKCHYVPRFQKWEPIELVK
jgi:hypothetical protein